jgi:hypothetical protein
MRHPSAADLNALTDARVGIIKAALQLTPDQEKYWPAVEEAIRARAKNRQPGWNGSRNCAIAAQWKRFDERNPVELMQRRAEILSQRAADLKKLADAWEPLYKTLTRIRKRGWPFAYIRGHALGCEIRLNAVSNPKMTTTKGLVASTATVAEQVVLFRDSAAVQVRRPVDHRAVCTFTDKPVREFSLGSAPCLSRCQ